MDIFDLYSYGFHILRASPYFPPQLSPIPFLCEDTEVRGSFMRIGPHRFETNVDRTESLRSGYPARTILIERIATDGRYLKLRSK